MNSSGKGDLNINRQVKSIFRGRVIIFTPV
jgi:hypothetical protein